MITKHAPPEGLNEVCIVGGGLAGSGLAITLARQGRRVLLLERDTFPRHKLCGEFLSTESRTLLRELGCLDEVLAVQPALINRARFTTPSGRQLEVPLPGEGLGISRWALDSILFNQAGRCGAETVMGAEVCGLADTPPCRDGSESVPATSLEVRPRGASSHASTWSARGQCVVLAHGRHGLLDRQLIAGSKKSTSAAVGFKRHCVPVVGAAGARLRQQLEGTVEVHGLAGGYCGISFIEKGQVNVCALVDKTFLDTLQGTDWEHLMEAFRRANPRLRERLDALEPVEDRVHAVAGITLRDRVRLHDRGEEKEPFISIGDATGMIAPLCGDGQAIALRSSLVLGALFEKHAGRLTGAEIRHVAEDWSRAWRREFATRLRMGRMLQAVFLKPTAAEVTIRLLALCPPLVRALVRSTRGR